MANQNDRLESNYSFAVNRGYAVLSRMAGRNDEWPPPNTGNVNDDIMVDAVYGGSASPDVPGEYMVYSVDWLDELPGQAGAAGDESQGADALEQAGDIAGQLHRVSGEPVESFRRYLDDNFKGWIYHHGRGEIYVMAEDSDEDLPSRFD